MEKQCCSSRYRFSCDFGGCVLSFASLLALSLSLRYFWIRKNNFLFSFRFPFSFAILIEAFYCSCSRPAYLPQILITRFVFGFICVRCGEKFKIQKRRSSFDRAGGGSGEVPTIASWDKNGSIRPRKLGDNHQQLSLCKARLEWINKTRRVTCKDKQ